jgi:hypothetical protein
MKAVLGIHTSKWEDGHLWGLHHLAFIGMVKQTGASVLLVQMMSPHSPVFQV